MAGEETESPSHRMREECQIARVTYLGEAGSYREGGECVVVGEGDGVVRNLGRVGVVGGVEVGGMVHQVAVVCAERSRVVGVAVSVVVEGEAYGEAHLPSLVGTPVAEQLAER